MSANATVAFHNKKSLLYCSVCDKEQEQWRFDPQKAAQMRRHTDKHRQKQGRMIHQIENSIDFFVGILWGRLGRDDAEEIMGVIRSLEHQKSCWSSIEEVENHYAMMPLEPSTNEPARAVFSGA